MNDEQAEVLITLLERIGQGIEAVDTRLESVANTLAEISADGFTIDFADEEEEDEEGVVLSS